MSDAHALESAFRRIDATRMQDMPLRNSALEVEAAAFREWDGRRVGVLIAPWTISLVVMSGEENDVQPLALNERQRWNFPGGEYEFMGASEPECGVFHACSLFSPPTDIADQLTARAIAQEVMQQLFRQPEAVSRRALLTATPPNQARVE